MTNFQRIIKYGAIAFAIYLAVTIISAIIFGFTLLFGITIGIDALNGYSKHSIVEYEENRYTNIDNIEIDLNVCRLQIKKSNEIRVETINVSNKFELKVDGKTLKIKDNNSGFSWFNNFSETPEVIIYLPTEFEFNKIDMKLGVGESKIEYLKAKEISIDMGVGKNVIYELIAKNAKIKGGMGETNIYLSQIESLDLDSGLGALEITSKIDKRADISSGVGRLELNLEGNIDDYNISANKGIGNFKVDNRSVFDGEVIGNGNSNIKVKAGIGETIVNFVTINIEK